MTQVTAGGVDSLFLKCDGSLWAMGWDRDGQLGDGTGGIPPLYSTNLPELIVASNVTAIAAAGVDGQPPLPISLNNHSLFIKSDGSLWGMGAETYGELGNLGDGNDGATDLPEEILASNVTAIASGTYHTLLLKSDGSLWAMGDNEFGELGDGTDNTTNGPEQIAASNVTAIAAGGAHSLFLKSDGSLWAMGFNNSGQLGDGTYNNSHLPEEIVASNVTAIVAGTGHSLFLKNNGSLWAMGFNNSGQLGDGTYNSTNQPEEIVAGGVTAIAAGEYHSLFLKSDGSLWAMGDESCGELGDGTYGTAPYFSTNRPQRILAPYNQISGQLLGGTNMNLSFVGIANANYALDRSASLSPPNWIPQLTNPASSYGPLVFTNTPDPSENNFWRIRSVP